MYYFNYKRYISQSISEPHRTQNLVTAVHSVYCVSVFYTYRLIVTLNNINIYDLYFVRRIYFLNNLH